MPKRGDIIRQLGEELRKNLHDLGSLVALEKGKILPEGIGEVQEFIGTSSYFSHPQIFVTMLLVLVVLLVENISNLKVFFLFLFIVLGEDHTLLEVWNPLGVMGVITGT